MNDINCTVFVVSGDQTNHWEMVVKRYYSTITFEQARLLFEIYNRAHNEYAFEVDDDGDETESYSPPVCSIDNLTDEMKAAHEKRVQEKKDGLNFDAQNDWMPGFHSNNFGDLVNEAIRREPEHYGVLSSLNISGIRSLEDCFKKDNCNEFYFENQTRTINPVCMRCNHLYTVAELFEGKETKLDFSDEDVICPFGTNRFAAFADFSYGC